MKILSIETSADETAVSIVEAAGEFPTATYQILGDALLSQTELHNEYGGIYPTIAKREHAKALPLMLRAALEKSEQLTVGKQPLIQEQTSALTELFQREEGLADAVIEFLETHKKPDIDLIGVTSGPGLEPTLWVGINFAKALALAWDIPVVPVNHMEGHLLASIFDGEKLPLVAFPALGLLISGGHTEIDLMTDWNTYERIGETRDDAVGEAFDKVARMLGLPYPGGPEISKLASIARQRMEPYEPFTKLPRPMLDSGDLDFSFSGLKTAVRYAIEGKDLTETDKQSIALEFENAVTAVLLKKVCGAIEMHGAGAVIIGGGVSANHYIRDTFKTHLEQHYPDVALYVPGTNLSTDNAIMIALAAHARSNSQLTPTESQEKIKADGNRSLAEE